MKWRWGTKKQDSPVRGENRGVGTAEEIVSWDFWLGVSFQVQTAQNSFVKFATEQFYPIEAIIKNNGNIPRQNNPKHLYVCMYVFTDREGTKCPKKTILGRR